MNIENCLETVVGLSESQCECFAAPDGVDPTTSLSGYFIDDMEAGIPLKFPASAKDCGDDDVFNIMLNARSEACKEFITEFGSNLAEFTAPRFAEIISRMGEIQPKINVMLAVPMEDLVGVMMHMRRIRGGSMQINQIQIRNVGDLVDSNLRLYHSINNFATPILDPITFSAASGVLTNIELETQIELPLCDDFGNPITYALLYERQGSNPYNYRLTCGCTSKPKPAWYTYADVQGVNVADPSDCEEWDKIQNRTYGLILDTKFTCTNLDWICRTFDADWKRNGYWRVIAKTIQLMAINKVIGYILNSTQMNRYTLVKNEFLYGKRNHNRKEIAERLAWLSQMVPPESVDCYTCKAASRTKLAEILV